MVEDNFIELSIEHLYRTSPTWALDFYNAWLVHRDRLIDEGGVIVPAWTAEYQRLYQKRYRITHKAEIKKQKAQYYQMNRDKILENKKAYKAFKKQEKALLGGADGNENNVVEES